MDDPVISAARHRIQQIKIEIRDLERFVDAYDRVSPMLYGAREKGTPQKVLASMALEIISAASAPVPTRLLYEKLIENGAIIRGKSPVGNLSAKLFQSVELENIPGLGWWKKGEARNPDLSQEVVPDHVSAEQGPQKQV